MVAHDACSHHTRKSEAQEPQEFEASLSSTVKCWGGLREHKPDDGTCSSRQHLGGRVQCHLDSKFKATDNYRTLAKDKQIN